MTATQLIYLINQDIPRMSAHWQRLSLDDRRSFADYCRDLENWREIEPKFKDWRKQQRALRRALKARNNPENIGFSAAMC